MAIRPSGEPVSADDSADDVPNGDNEHQVFGPLHATPFSTATGLGSTAPGVGWGGKSQVREFVPAWCCCWPLIPVPCGLPPLQSELFHTMSEHEPPNDIALPPQVRTITAFRTYPIIRLRCCASCSHYCSCRS